MQLKHVTKQKKYIEKIAPRKPEKAGENTQSSRRKLLLAPVTAKTEKAWRKSHGAQIY